MCATGGAAVPFRTHGHAEPPDRGIPPAGRFAETSSVLTGRQ
ncbi:hypothetical protein KCH_48480 [Kitasatospora cheerisanensis KCTC 2395]|uniref:Uncharacterized protein n=1 Tax=Kitasatospora cheerisanensis KCTC 2395 TaxID=1348663 RepID=A0A066YZ45_9ACTN|nr:hypothetical protein KCH_48480 [Kitasatospora cheerisanensis KCTC 2395]